jgi:hypothetical protein
VGGGSVYWIDDSSGLTADGAIMQCASGGCNQQPTTVATGQRDPSALAIDSTNVYWANAGIDGHGTDGSIASCALGGCNQTPTVLAGGIGPNSIAVNASGVYWTTTGNGVGSLWSCAPSGGTPMKLVDTMGIPWLLGVNATSLAWITSNGGAWTCSTNACSPTELSSMDSGNPTGCIDATNAYFALGGPTGGTITRCPVAGCGGVYTPVTPDLSFPGAAASDGTWLYFTTTPMGTGGGVYACPVTGCNGCPVTVATLSGVSTPSAIAFDATSVYWTDLNLGLVLKAAKP